jgi:hypothetical protein
LIASARHHHTAGTVVPVLMLVVADIDSIRHTAFLYGANDSLWRRRSPDVATTSGAVHRTAASLPRNGLHCFRPGFPASIRWNEGAQVHLCLAMPKSDGSQIRKAY